MNIALVDDEAPALRTLEEAVREVLSDCTIACFQAPSKAHTYAQGHRIDIAFLDIDMGGMNGIELAMKLKFVYPKTNIVFVTGFSQYAADSYEAEASDFLIKPATPERIEKALQRLRNPIQPSASRIRVLTFGCFEIFVDGIPVVFHRKKAKQLLAYLVDRKGASVTKKELSAVLWEDDDYSRSRQSHLQKLFEDMTKSLRAVGAEHILVKNRDGYAVDKAKFDCDLYRYLRGDVKALNAFTGEYMSSYSWAEDTAGFLTSCLQK